ncbi:MAG: UDP-N-acetylmuramoyl-L-alanyl-D-glutamate--2,6-diaminopimelate ligase, partial [Ignavibacteria bacterium]|nr:UDP-N-acetylmuramoyl-L-alanyl-D-glutamate--2,6-diaminopimelate ligase [Ignavibacteria bacterium]
TPDALQNTLNAIREILENQNNRTSKVTTVFGAGGNRDKSKRPLMGKVVQELSDSIIVTSDNPRKENPQAIINDILEGIKLNNSVTVIENREEAIKTAIEKANDNDIILIAGKGHETYQDIEGVKYYFNDADIADKYLKMRYQN